MKYRETHRPTPNITKGVENKREGVVFHHTAGTAAGAVAWLTDRASKASAHVVIARTGDRTTLADDTDVTWHAGHGKFRGVNPNLVTLGVEFELTVPQVKADEPLTKAQLESMIEWLRPRWSRYGWTIHDMTHHRAVDPKRKIDLSEKNWRLVHDRIVRDLVRNTPKWRVAVDGTQIGAYLDPTRAVAEAVSSDNARKIEITRI